MQTPAIKIIIQELIKSRLNTPADLASFKRKVAKKYKIPCPSNVQLLKAYHKLLKNKRIKKSEEIEKVLKTRPIRSLSGIVNVSVLTKPYPCPGKCLFCPLEKGIPKSYVSGEPAVERAKALNFDPYLQVKKRIEMLKAQGHPTDKIELRIVGGTWSYYQKNYQIWFIKECFRACNDFEVKNPKSKILNPKQIPNPKSQIPKLEREQRKNEKAKNRIVGISIETRPDFISPSEIKRLRGLGVTMVEIGVQSIYNDVLKKNLRGHTVKEIILATWLLKDAGFKVLYQMMPNLPGSNLKKDEKMFEELFSNSDFQPDLLKIYPCALLKEASLYKLWEKGKYRPYSKEQLIELIKSIKKKIPYYVRIQRIARDIPSPRIVTGPAKISNLRQVITGLSKIENWKCKCIRCREVKENYNPQEKLYLFRQDYDASGGKEIFLSFESKNQEKLYSLLRLRIPGYVLSLGKVQENQIIQKTENGSRHIRPILKNAAIIREVHTYGQLLPITKKEGEQFSFFSPQHKGLGKKLIKKAEKIAKDEFFLKKIVAISGIGVRSYWRKLGYRLRDTYMVKIFS